MLDREKVVAVLGRRFPQSTAGQIAAAANAIIGLEDEWMEVTLPRGGLEAFCQDGCYLRRVSDGRDIRIFRRMTGA
jgi:hypothetical protein